MLNKNLSNPTALHRAGKVCYPYPYEYNNEKKKEIIT